MAQIAKEAGLSRFTVSKILNGDPSVRKGNREKVLALFEKHGYVPNSNAVNLVSGTSRVIGMVVPYITDGFYAELIEIAEKYAAEKGYTLTYQSSYNDAVTERNIIRSLLGLKVAALLIVPVVLSPDRKIHQLAAANCPVIYLDRSLDGEHCTLLNDNRESCRLITNHLFEQASEVAFLDSFYEESNQTAVDRKQGYLDAVKEHHATPIIISHCDKLQFQDNELYGYYKMSEYLQQNPTPPKGICCVTDSVALGAMQALREAGFIPGKDVLIGGHDNLRFGEFISPALTTVAQPKEEMAIAAVDMVLQRIAEPDTQLKSRIFHSKLVIRESSNGA